MPARRNPAAKRGPGRIPIRDKFRAPLPERIRNAAERVFAETDLEHATWAAIAKRAHLSIPTVRASWREAPPADRRSSDAGRELEALHQTVVARIVRELREEVERQEAATPTAWAAAAGRALASSPVRARVLLRELLAGGRTLEKVAREEIDRALRALEEAREADPAPPGDAARYVRLQLLLLAHTVLGPLATQAAARRLLGLDLRRRDSRQSFLAELEGFLAAGANEPDGDLAAVPRPAGEPADARGSGTAEAQSPPPDAGRASGD